MLICLVGFVNRFNKRTFKFLTILHSLFKMFEKPLFYNDRKGLVHACFCNQALPFEKKYDTTEIPMLLFDVLSMIQLVATEHTGMIARKYVDTVKITQIVII